MSEDAWEQSIEAEMERYLSIGEMFEQNRIIRYVYDPGNYWLHQITLASWKEDIQSSLPSCILASGIAPAEDAINLDGYAKPEKTGDFPKKLDFSTQSRLELTQINKALGKL